jgi:hypothetical protein
MAFLHASKSGYFPFCLEEATEGQYGPGTDRPFEMSLEDAMTLYWKYRTIKITGTISGSFSYYDEAEEDFEFFYPTIIGTGIPMDNGQPKMSDVVCNSLFSSIFGFQRVNEPDPTDNDPVLIPDSVLFESRQYGIQIGAGGSVKKTPEPNSGEELKILTSIGLDSDAFYEGSFGTGFLFFGKSTPIGDFDDFISTAVPDGFQIKINGTTYKAPFYWSHSPLFSGSGAGFLLIEGVDERLTE